MRGRWDRRGKSGRRMWFEDHAMRRDAYDEERVFIVVQFIEHYQLYNSICAIDAQCPSDLPACLLHAV